MSLTRRLLAGLLLACSAVVVLGGAPALAACPPADTDLQQRSMDADAIFTGVVASAATAGTTTTFTVDVDRIYKGETDEQVSVSTDARPGSCGLPGLVTGTAYVFFAQDDSGDLTIDRRSGTRTASETYVARVEDLLGQGRSAVPPPPIEATFTTVADPPADVQRLAAPGVALVIIGVLGLVFVAWRGRRRA